MKLLSIVIVASVCAIDAHGAAAFFNNLGRSIGNLFKPKPNPQLPFLQPQQQQRFQPLAPMLSALPLNNRQERAAIAWLEYFSTVLMDVGADWAVTDLNREIYERTQRTLNTPNPFKFMASMLGKLREKAQRFGMKVRQAFGIDQRIRLLYASMKAGRMLEAGRLIMRPDYMYNVNEELLKMKLAARLILIDAANRKSIVRFWSPQFRLNVSQKLQVLDYYDRVRLGRCLEDVPPLGGLPYSDLIRLRVLSVLNRPITQFLNMGLSGDEVSMARVSSAFTSGELCAAGEIRPTFKNWFTTPRAPNYARYFGRVAGGVCVGDLAWRNYADYCQVHSKYSLPLGLLLKAGCPNSVKIESVSRLERLYWAQVWVGDCEGAREALLALRDSLAHSLLDNPAITVRYNYLVSTMEKCQPSGSASNFKSQLHQGITKLLEYGHYKDAMFEWRMFHSANCKRQGPVADELELLIRIAANPRAIYTPCLTNSLLTSDPVVNLEILRKAEKYGMRREGGRFLASLMNTIRSEPAIRMRMKAAMIAGRLDVARELARQLPRDQEAAEISACSVLCGSRNDACKARGKYSQLLERASPSNSINLGMAISETVCQSVSIQSFDPVSIKYDLQLSVDDALRRIYGDVSRSDLGRLYVVRRRFGAVRTVVGSEVMSAPAVPGLSGTDLIPLPVLDQYGRTSDQSAINPMEPLGSNFENPMSPMNPMNQRPPMMMNQY